MKLIIQNETTRMHVDDTYSIESSMLKFKSTHMFIASNQWDSISIEVNDNMEPEDVKYFHNICENVYCILPKTINEKVLLLLCTIYPDKAGELRLAFMLSKDLNTILPKEVT